MENWFSISFLTYNVVTVTSISQACPKLNVVMLINCSVACLSHAIESLEVSGVATSLASASSRKERNILSHHIFIRGFETKEKDFRVMQRLRGVHSNILRMKGQEEWHVKATDSMCRTDSSSTQPMRDKPQAQLRPGQEVVNIFRKICEVQSNL